MYDRELTTTMDPTSTITYKIDYPSLPPEIRNQIMRYALSPGHIHPSYTRCGVQLLATNRQNYEDGHIMFYSDNVFHVPRFKNGYTGLLHHYQPKHLNLIRRVQLACSILDLDKESTEECARSKPPSDIHERRQILGWLSQLWISRVLTLPRILPSLDELSVKLPDYKPSRVWLTHQKMLDIQGQWWYGTTRWDKLGRPTLVLKRRNRSTTHVTSEPSITALLNDEPFVRLMELLETAMIQTLVTVRRMSRGQGGTPQFWDWLEKKQEESTSELAVCWDSFAAFGFER